MKKKKDVSGKGKQKEAASEAFDLMDGRRLMS